MKFFILFYCFIVTTVVSAEPVPPAPSCSSGDGAICIKNNYSSDKVKVKVLSLSDQGTWRAGFHSRDYAGGEACFEGKSWGLNSNDSITVGNNISWNQYCRYRVTLYVDDIAEIQFGLRIAPFKDDGDGAFACYGYAFCEDLINMSQNIVLLGYES